LDTRLELIKFYDSHYSANLMQLVVYGKGSPSNCSVFPYKLYAVKTFFWLFCFSYLLYFADSLDNLQNLVENKFCDIRDVGRKPFSFPGHPCTPEHLQVCYLQDMSLQRRLAATDACALVYASCSLAGPCQSSSH
jgi:insulysin